MDTDLDQSIDQFENELKSGLSPRIEGILSELSDDSKTKILHELISLEIFYRFKSGLPVRISEYARFGQSAAIHAEQVLEEYNAKNGAHPSQESENGQQSKMIGPYRLLQKIGEGGMGAVWMAEQLEPVKRRVALKLIKSELASKEIIARFDAEKQALAMMEHPNIAKVLDAGTLENGSPYFVMELVKGIPLTEYCDTNKLSVEERLRLFVSVCKAVDHAHRKSILHRDLKPSNVLVTSIDGEPVPKVIDFGLAKATTHNLKLTDKTMFTEFGKVIGTPQYMSPEQAKMSGLDVDTRSDIYSLGVMLYELLTGSTPVDKETLATSPFLEVLEIIGDKDPPLPSSRLSLACIEATSVIGAQRKIKPEKLQNILHGELDWVVMKALEKDRTRRYQTAIDLAKDISNFLDGATVSARPPSTWYQFQKFLSKNRGLVASALAIGFVALAGIAGTSYGLLRSNEKTSDFDNVEIVAGKTASATPDKGQRDGTGESTGQRSGFNWNLTDRHSIETCATYSGHSGKVYRVAFSPDGDRIASSSGDKTVKLWDRATGSEIATLNGHSHSVGSVAFSPSGNRLASASYDQTIRLWDSHTFEEITTLEGHKDLVAEVVFSPDGVHLASASDDKTIKSWDVESGREITTFEGHSAEVARVVFSPDGKRLASASADQTVKLWDVETGQAIMTLKGHSRGVGSVAFSPDGTRLASASSNIIKLWDTSTGDEIKTLQGHEGWIHGVAFSPDGACLASASADKTIKLWNPDSGQETETLKGHSLDVGSVAFSPTGAHLVSASFDSTIKLWKVTLD